ncbi:MAG: hypothetical protein HZC48_13835 [Nitrospirae bacterium]|nr:hypothetical protein [Nitrospirota bacterium]
MVRKLLKDITAHSSLTMIYIILLRKVKELFAGHNLLFVVDASVFPSSGGGESPSLIIEALALRTAEHIRDLC